MTDESPQDRRYDDSEADLILRRAAELQSMKSGSSLSLTELEQIASEASIDPAYVRIAARDFAPRTPVDITRESRTNRLARFIGSATSVSAERSTRGNLSAETATRLIDELRETFHDDGTILGTGDYQKWRAEIPGLFQRRVSATFATTAGETTIRVEEDLRSILAWIRGWGMILGGGVAFAITTVRPIVQYIRSPWVGYPIVFGGMALGFYFARHLIARLYQKRGQDITDLADRLIALVRTRA